MGYWVDMEDPYVTYKPTIETVSGRSSATSPFHTTGSPQIPGGYFAFNEGFGAVDILAWTTTP
jgi:hypothetical protein